MTAAMVAGALVVALMAGCGGDGDGAAGSGTTAAVEDAGGETTAAPTTTAAPEDTCADDLEVTGAGAADGPLTPGSFWSRGTGYPGALEGEDRRLDLALASYEIPEDPQFGFTIPVGEPTVPEGELLLLASMSRSPEQGPIEIGSRFLDVFEDDLAPDEAGIGNIRLYHGSEWLSDLVPLELTVTDLSDDMVCASFAKLDPTGDGPALEGSFTTERTEVLNE